MPATVYAQNSIPPVLLCIVTHESGAQQFRADGSPLISPTDDVGFMQINIPAWLSTANRMGLDIIHSEADNIEFGIWLYNTRGVDQWTTYKKYCNGSEDS